MTSAFLKFDFCILRECPSSTCKVKIPTSVDRFEFGVDFLVMPSSCRYLLEMTAAYASQDVVS